MQTPTSSYTVIQCVYTISPEHCLIATCTRAVILALTNLIGIIHLYNGIHYSMQEHSLALKLLAAAAEQ